MRRDEYEQRKQRLETQLREGIALLEAAHRQQVRALELVWLTTAEEDLAFSPEPAAGRSDSPPPPAPSRPRRRGPGELEEEIEDALAGVPDVFDRNDVCRVLGYAPDRGSLYRVLQELTDAGRLTVQQRGSGRTTTQYRKSPDGFPPPGL
jgi:predicted pyridoxine 5'-phosphate oxidase superfamily flavin-nucleotide-binding protein